MGTDGINIFRPLGCQPMVADGPGLALAFNGEIYNFRELRTELEACGASFVSQSDTEVLLRGYERWGTAVLDRLVGMFAFALWDGPREQLFLARDRAGEKPLYYAERPWGFAFASELAGLEDLQGVDLTIDQQALALYLNYQYIPSPHTIYQGVRKLPPAHAMIVSGGEARVWRYWDPVTHAIQHPLNLPDAEAEEQLEMLLRRAVRGQMIADVPLGAFLSGGVDSSTVVSLMAESSSRPVKTFTIGFDVAGFDESAHAARVAQHLGTEHTAEYLTEQDVLRLVPEVPGMYAEPFGDASAIPTHLVSRVAREHVTVCLSGDGGDEAFGGYTSYAWLERIARVSALLGPIGGAVAPLLSRVPGKLQRVGTMLGRAPQEAHRSLMSTFSPDDVAALVGIRPTLVESERAWKNSAHLPVRRRAMLADLLTYMPEAILVKVDRAAMAVSLETRAPFLDHRVLEFALRLEPRHVRNKALLRRILYRRAPRALLDRPKRGFSVPLERWFRGELRSLLGDVLTPQRMAAAGIDDYPRVRRLLDEHLRGVHNHASRLWLLLVLGLWQGAASREADSHPVLSPFAA